MAPTNTGDIEKSTIFIKEIVEKTDYATFTHSIIHASRDVFFITDGNDNKYAIKIIDQDGYNREIFCSEFAKRIGLDDVVLPIKTLANLPENKLIIMPYCYFYEPDKEPSVSLLDVVDNTPNVQNNDFINKNKNNLWQSNLVNNKARYVFSSLNQLNFEKALIFSFLTLQQDLNNSNVFLKIINNNFLSPELWLKLFDFSYSMTETNILNRPTITANGGSTIFYKQNNVLLEKNYFKKNLAKLPSDEIKKIVNHFQDFNYDDLFENFGQTKEDDKKSFYHRIADLVQAFKVDQNTESIGDIISSLFKKHFDIISKAEEDLVNPASFRGKGIAQKKARTKLVKLIILGMSFPVVLGGIFALIVRTIKNIKTNPNN